MASDTRKIILCLVLIAVAVVAALAQVGNSVSSNSSWAKQSSFSNQRQGLLALHRALEQAGIPVQRQLDDRLHLPADALIVVARCSWQPDSIIASLKLADEGETKKDEDVEESEEDRQARRFFGQDDEKHRREEAKRRQQEAEEKLKTEKARQAYASRLAEALQSAAQQGATVLCCLPQKSDALPPPFDPAELRTQDFTYDPQELSGWRECQPFALPANMQPLLFLPDGRCLLAMQKLGKGRLVLMASSQPLNNEALQRQPPAALLEWLLADHRQVVFEETHLGLQERRGSLALMKEYRLVPWLFCAFLTALLWAWAVSSPLQGFRPDQPESDDLADGLERLFAARLVPAEALRAACERWEESLPQQDPRRAALPQMRDLLAGLTNNSDEADVQQRLDQISRLLTPYRSQQGKSS